MTAEQLRGGRAMLRWSQEELAAKAGISAPTVKRLEAASGPLPAHNATVRALRDAFERAGVQFIDPNGGGAGLRITIAG